MAKQQIWDQRMLSVMQHHISNGITRKEWCQSVGILPNNIHDIKKGRRSFTVEQIHNCCTRYRINPGWIFGMSQEMTLGKGLPPIDVIKAALKVLEVQLKTPNVKTPGCKPKSTA